MQAIRGHPWEPEIKSTLPIYHFKGSHLKEHKGSWLSTGQLPKGKANMGKILALGAKKGRAACTSLS